MQQSIHVTIAGDIVAELNFPRSLPEGRWLQIPPDLRDEALERMGWISFRGTVPEKALEKALQGMHEDLLQVEVEPSWQVIRFIANSWPSKRRKPSGHYYLRIMELASAVESIVRAELEIGGQESRSFAHVDHLIPSVEFRAVLNAAIDERLAVLVARQEPVCEMLSQPDDNGLQ